MIMRENVRAARALSAFASNPRLRKNSALSSSALLGLIADPEDGPALVLAFWLLVASRGRGRGRGRGFSDILEVSW
jgi:hypothetical protein